MDASPNVASRSESEHENHSLGRVIFNRIGTLERHRLQTKFLQLLSATRVWHQMVFRGAVAIHGVHLHGRCSRDLDFLAPPDIKNRFVEILGEQGLVLQKKDEDHMAFLPMQGTVFKEIAVGIDVCARETCDMNPVPGVFHGAGGVRLPVRVMALAPQMAEKLRATSRRARSTDFYDVWLFSQKCPELLPELGRLLHVGEVDGEELEFSAEDTWLHLQQLGPWWHKDLIPLMAQVPPFETIERDFARLIERFSTASIAYL